MRMLFAISLALIIFLSSLAVLPLTDDGRSNDRQSAASPEHSTRATLKVGPGQTYTTIQAALDAASAGDTVLVYNSTYSEHIYLNRSITMKGNSSAGTVIDGKGSGDVVTINANWCNISGFLVNRSGASGSGVLVNSDHNRVLSCHISYSYVGILFASGSDNNAVENCTIADNIDSGAKMTDADQNALVFSEFIDNKVGVNVTGTSAFNQIHHNNFIGNTATGCQAKDAFGTSAWDNGTVGNYWDEYTDTDSDYDGIYDNDYTINAAYSAYDHNPLLPPWRCPKIRPLSFNNPIEDLAYYLNFTAYSVNLPPGPLNWGLASNAAWLTLGAPSNLSGTARNEDLGKLFYFNVTAKATNGRSDFKNYTVSVVNTNDPPLVTSSSLPDCYEDGLYQFQLTATDLDPTGDTIKWAVNSNASFLTVGLNSGLLTGMPSNSNIGRFWVNISATDDKEGTGYRNLTIDAKNVNDPPTIDTFNVVTCYEDALYSVQYNATDIDPTQDALAWSLTTNSSFLSITPSGLLSGTPDNSMVGPWSVCVNVSDGKGGWAVSAFNLTVVNTNDPPVITTQNLETCLEGLPYSVTYNATDEDPNNDIIIWKVSTDAGFLSMNSALRVLFGMPDDDDIGSYWVNVTCSDGAAMDWTNFTLTVQNSNDAPEVADRPLDISIDEDTTASPIDLNEWFYDRDGDTLSFYCLQNENITVEISKGGLASVTPKQDWSGVAELTFIADDSLAQVSDSLVVNVFPVNDPPKDAAIIFAEAQYVQGKPQPANGSCADPDLGYGDVLTFKWYSNISKDLGSGKDIDLKLKAGHHLITLNVTDKSGKWCVASRELLVLAPGTNITPDDDTDDDIVKDNDTDKDGLPDWWEKQFFTNLSYGPNDDPDGDSRSNLKEYKGGTDPSQPDADEETPSFIGSTMFYVLIAAAIVIVLIIVIAVIVLRKKPEKADEEGKKDSAPKAEPAQQAAAVQPSPQPVPSPQAQPQHATADPPPEGLISKGLQSMSEGQAQPTTLPELTPLPEPEPAPMPETQPGSGSDKWQSEPVREWDLAPKPGQAQGAPGSTPAAAPLVQQRPKDANEKAIDDLFNV